MNKFMQRLLPMEELFETVKRFPLTVLSAVALFVIVFIENHKIISFDDEIIGRVVCILGCLYFWFGISKLIAESQNLSFVRQSLISFAGGLAIIALIGLTEIWGLHLAFILPALLLGIMFAPYLKGGDDISFWFFNRMMWFGVVVSYAALILFALGMSAALGAIDALFSVKIDHKIYQDIWSFAGLILGPVYALSWVPKQFEFTQEDCHDPPGLKFIVNWISVPMVFVYMAILYAYFGKIIINWEVPNGVLAYLISGFVGAGIVTYLTAWPMREIGSAQLRLFYRIFFLALLIPVGFHFFAIWERVSAYGFTEQRYALMLSAIWFATLAVGNVMSRMPIKVIPASLCVLLVLASFGPWGAVGVSGHSQFSRLKGLLEQNNLLVDGKVQVAKGNLSAEDRKSISSILDYLCRSKRRYMIEDWFTFDDEGRLDGCYAGNLTKQLGFDYLNKWQGRNAGDDYMIDFNRYRDWDAEEVYTDVSSYDVMVANIIVNSYWDIKTQTIKDWHKESVLGNGQRIKFSFNTPVLKIEILSPEGTVEQNIDINLNDYADSHVSMVSDDDVLEPIVFEDGEIAYRVDVTSISGKTKDNKNYVTDFRFNLFYRLKP